MERKSKRRNLRAIRARKLHDAKKRHEDHPYLENILKRIEHDDSYYEIRIKHNNRIVCFYCGQKATGVDHQPPLSKIDEYKEICKSKRKEVKLIKVSCCGECNRLLANSVFSSFEAKLANLRRRLRKKYKNLPEDDKIEYKRLQRRLSFERGINRIRGKHE